MFVLWDLCFCFQFCVSVVGFVFLFCSYRPPYICPILKTQLTLNPSNQYNFGAESYNQYILCVRITTYPRAV